MSDKFWQLLSSDVGTEQTETLMLTVFWWEPDGFTEKETCRSLSERQVVELRFITEQGNFADKYGVENFGAWSGGCHSDIVAHPCSWNYRSKGWYVAPSYGNILAENHYCGRAPSLLELEGLQIYRKFRKSIAGPGKHMKYTLTLIKSLHHGLLADYSWHYYSCRSN